MNVGSTTATVWHDYQPNQTYFGSDNRLRGAPSHATHLRIGFLQNQQFLEGNTTTTTTVEVPDKAFQSHPNLVRIQIYLPAVSRIGVRAFYNCQKLECVEFLIKSPRQQEEENQEENTDNDPQSQLISIGRYSFFQCENLQSVVGLEHAKDSLQEIEEQAFNGCRSLINVNFLSQMTHLQSLGSRTFEQNAVTIVDLSKAVQLTELPCYAFMFCRALTFVHLPPNLQSIGIQAFSFCKALEEIQLPDGLQTIGEASFWGCRKLKSIVLPSSLQRIGRRCFWECDGLGLVVLPSSRVPFLKALPFGAACKSLSSLELPDSVPRHQWPLILEQFCQEDGIASECGEISDAKNRNTVVWNFLCQNMAQFFMEDNRGVMSRRRGAAHL